MVKVSQLMPSDPTLSIQHNNQLKETEGKNKVVFAVVTTIERKAIMAARQ
jgi:hypothetical protein